MQRNNNQPFLTNSELNKINENIKDDVEVRNLKRDLRVAKKANDSVRKIIPTNHSYTLPTLKDHNTLFSLRKRVKWVRKLSPTFDEVFECFLLTNSCPLNINFRLTTKKSQEFHVGNCGELSKLSIKVLRRYLNDGGDNERPSMIEYLSIKNSDHAIVRINGNTILDTLNEKFYPSSEIFEKLQCYRFDTKNFLEKKINNPHILTPFTVNDELVVEGAITCFRDYEYNQRLVDQFFIKLDIIEKSFKKYSSTESANELAETIKKFKIEIGSYDLSNRTNLEIERLLDRKLKWITKIKNFVENREDLYFDIIINMHTLYDSPFEYFIRLIYLQPLFSALISYMESDDSTEMIILRNQLKDKDLLNQLLYETLLYKMHISDRNVVKKILINQGADLLTVLTRSLNCKNKEVVQKLIKSKDKEGFLPLHLAIMRNRADIIKYYLRYQLDLLDSQDINGWTPLHHACKRGDANLVQALLQRAADFTIPTNDPTTRYLPLHIAVIEGYIKVVKLLIDIWSQSVNFTDAEGWTALHAAAQIGHIDIVKELLLHDPDLSIQTKNDQWSPLHLAVLNNHIEIVTLILNHTKDPKLINYRDSEGYSALHYASHYGYLEHFIELLEGGARLEQRTMNGFSCLHIAVMENHEDIVELILNKSPDLINLRDKDGFTALEHAQEYGYDHLIKLICEREDESKIDKPGHTPF